MTDPHNLMMQAPATVALYLRHAKEEIDNCFGEGYAKENPQLVTAFLQACSDDFMTAMKARSADRL